MNILQQATASPAALPAATKAPIARLLYTPVVGWISTIAAMSICVLCAYRYAIAFPVTDDWAFAVNAMLIERGNWSELIWHINGHPTIAPFLVFWPMAELSHYDSRCMIAVTILCLALQLLLFQRVSGARGIELLPAALLLFGLSHWMEYQWGILMTLAMGQTAALWALFWFNRFLTNKQVWPLVLAFVLAGLSIGSYAAGPTCLAAAMALVVLRPNSIRLKLSALALLAVLFTTSYLAVPKALYVFDFTKVALYLLSSIGALTIGSDVAILISGWSLLASIGLISALLTATAVLAAGWRLRDEREAFFVSGIILSLVSMAAVALSRTYMGNWHVQLGLPVLLGMYGLWLCNLRHRPHAWLRKSGTAASAAILCATLIGDYQTWTVRAPAFRTYLGWIEAYSLNYDPKAPKPYPPPVPKWDINPDILGFLKAKGHSSFN